MASHFKESISITCTNKILKNTQENTKNVLQISISNFLCKFINMAFSKNYNL